MLKQSVSACIAPQGEIAKAVLMPGDPLRAKFVAEHYLENPVCFNTVRNMLGYTGLYKGVPLSVMGSGMGIPSFSLYATELYTQFGVEVILRIGSTGALQDDVAMKDIVIAEAASTDSAYADGFDFPGRLTPCASFSLLRTAVETAEAMGLRAKVGPIFSSDHFYFPDPNAKEKLRAFGMLAVEMETAGLYWTASACKKKALSILTVSDHLFTGEVLSAEDRQNSFHDMMLVALETARKTLQ